MGRFGEISHQIRAQRLEVVNPLAGHQALDAVRVAQTLLEQALTPARQLPRVFLLDRGHANHRAYPRLTAMPRHPRWQGRYHRLSPTASPSAAGGSAG